MQRWIAIALLSALAFALALASCRAPRPAAPAIGGVDREGDEIAACGQLFHTGTRVVLWTDPGGYDAYRSEPRFPEDMTAEDKAAWKFEPSFHSLRQNAPEKVQQEAARNGWSLPALQPFIDQFVIHFDVCGTSRQCFKVLHDERRLSVHFLLDVDGTIYQTLDLKERAWHAAEANDRSIGVEIAHIGAYPKKADPVLIEWYPKDSLGPYVRFPKWMKETGIRTPDFVARPARRGLLSGPIHGTTYYQYDFTTEQYRALAHLAAALHGVFPKIRLDYPRAGNGKPLTRALSAAELQGFSGLLGHYHVTKRKTDPGPAFDWERVVKDARKLAADA